MTSTIAQETRTDAMRRMLQIARDSGVRLLVATSGDFYATSVSQPGMIYLVTPESCGCRGFEQHRHCRHVAALWSHLGYLSDAPEVVPATEAPCQTCNGTGWEHVTHRLGHRYVDSAVRCTSCEGRKVIVA